MAMLLVVAMVAMVRSSKQTCQDDARFVFVVLAAVFLFLKNPNKNHIGQRAHSGEQDV